MFGQVRLVGKVRQGFVDFIRLGETNIRLCHGRVRLVLVQINIR